MIGLKCKVYFGLFMSYGYYRGFNNTFRICPRLDTLNRYQKLEHNHDFLIDKLLHGLLISLVFTNPGLHPLIIYSFIKRTEKRILGLEVLDKDYEW